MKRLMVHSLALLALAGLPMSLVASPIFTSVLTVQEDLAVGSYHASVNEEYLFKDSGQGWIIELKDTGLETVGAVHLELLITYNFIPKSGNEEPQYPGVMHWNVSWNDTNIGGWSWSHEDDGIKGVGLGGSRHEYSLNLSGLNLLGDANGDGDFSYKFAMFVGQDMPVGGGSIGVRPTSVLLSSAPVPVPVPEPGVFLLLLSGLGLVAYFGYRSRRPTAAWRRGLPRVT